MSGIEYPAPTENLPLFEASVFIGDGTLLNTANVWRNTNQFNLLPTSSGTPTTSNQLITKAYGDTTYGGIATNLLASVNAWTATNTFQSSGNPVSVALSSSGTAVSNSSTGEGLNITPVGLIGTGTLTGFSLNYQSLLPIQNQTGIIDTSNFVVSNKLTIIQNPTGTPSNTTMRLNASTAGSLGLSYFDSVGSPFSLGGNGGAVLITGGGVATNLEVSNGNVLLNTAGNYIQFPDASQQTTAYVPFTSPIAIGTDAGQFTQGAGACALGILAGNISQGDNAVAIGTSAGQTSQVENAVAIGNTAGQLSQGDSAIAIGNTAGQTSQVENAVAIGTASGQNEQGDSAIAIGNSAGQTSQVENAVAIGNSAGNISQGDSAIAIGNSAGGTSQVDNAVAIGTSAGYYEQGDSAVAIGNTAGYSEQGDSAVAIGNSAGQTSQVNNAVAIGTASGQTEQGDSAIAIGNTAARRSQGDSAIAIGNSAGNISQGDSAIAIGNYAGMSNQPANSICINASPLTSINAPIENSCVIYPIRTETVDTNYLTMWNSDTGELTCSSVPSISAKTFVIDHPKDASKYLVHSCLEGAEAGVYYRGKGEITNSVSTTINLPDYVDKLACEFTIQLTAIYDGKIKTYNSTEVIGNEFKVFGENGNFFWHIHGKRSNIKVEPLKSEVDVRGDGPYRYIV